MLTSLKTYQNCKEFQTHNDCKVINIGSKHNNKQHLRKRKYLQNRKAFICSCLGIIILCFITIAFCFKDQFVYYQNDHRRLLSSTSWLSENDLLTYFNSNRKGNTWICKTYRTTIAALETKNQQLQRQIDMLKSHRDATLSPQTALQFVKNLSQKPETKTFDVGIDYRGTQTFKVNIYTGGTARTESFRTNGQPDVLATEFKTMLRRRNYQVTYERKHQDVRNYQSDRYTFTKK